VIAGQDTSNGSDFVYSNLSYSMLGMVIEAVSGESYEDFCQQHIFGPLRIVGSNVPPWWKVVAPFGGWRMELSDILTIWKVFDIHNPTLLTAATLKTTLLGKLGGPISKNNSSVYYTLGAYVQQEKDNGTYVLRHDGLARFFRNVPVTYYTYVEKSFPGYAWAISASPIPDFDSGKLPSGVSVDVRLMLKGELHRK
jgi:D-alanyl-D-alanine carboxypeptidase